MSEMSCFKITLILDWLLINFLKLNYMPKFRIRDHLLYVFQALRVVCQDMFFSRAHNNPTPQTRLALEQTLGTIKKQEEKMSVVGDIVDMKVDGPTRIDFSEQVKT